MEVASTSSAFGALQAESCGGALVVWGDKDAGGDSSSVLAELQSVSAVFSNKNAFAAVKRPRQSIVSWGRMPLGGDFIEAPSDLVNVNTISAARSVFAAITTEGHVVTWGDASEGGNSSSVQSQLNSVVAVTCAMWGACAAIKRDGSVVTWGHESRGGDSSEVQPQLTSVTLVVSTQTAFAALRKDNSVIAWGGADFGGSAGSVAMQLTMVQALFATNQAFAVKRNRTCESHTCAASAIRKLSSSRLPCTTEDCERVCCEARTCTNDPSFKGRCSNVNKLILPAWWDVAPCGPAPCDLTCCVDTACHNTGVNFTAYSCPNATMKLKQPLPAAACPGGQCGDSYCCDEILCKPGLERLEGTCKPCVAGKYSAGTEACEECDIGRYSGARAAHCEFCREGSGMTTLKKFGSGDWVRSPGATNNSSCGCQRGQRLAFNRSCLQRDDSPDNGWHCGHNIECHGMDEVVVLEGFLAFYSPEPQSLGERGNLSVYSCGGNAEWCPGKRDPGLGQCASGRVGTVCAECATGMKGTADGTCEPCEDEDAGIPTAFRHAGVFALCILSLAVFYFLCSFNRGMKRQSLLTILLSILCSQLFAMMQMLGTMRWMQVSWTEPILSVFKLSSQVTLSMDWLNLRCIGDFDPWQIFVIRALLLPGVLVVLFLVHCLRVFIPFVCHRADRLQSGAVLPCGLVQVHKPQFALVQSLAVVQSRTSPQISEVRTLSAGIAQSATPVTEVRTNQSRGFRVSDLVNVLGSFMSIVLIMMVGSMSSPFHCLRHPNDRHTILSQLNVLCFEFDNNPDYSRMVYLSPLLLTLPLSYLCACVMFVRLLPSRARAGDRSFLRSCSFLVFRFNKNAQWCAVFVAIRNVLLAAMPIILDAVSQIAYLMVVLGLSLIVTCRFMPWRAQAANILDICLHSAQLCIVVYASIFIQSPSVYMASALLTVAVCASAALLLVGAMATLALACARHRKKPIDIFFSYVQKEAGSAARLLQMELQFSGGARKMVHLLVDRLLPSELLLDDVAYNSCKFCALCTRGFFLSSSCLSESSVAINHSVPAIVVSLASFDMRSIDDLHITAASVERLVEQGVTADMVLQVVSTFLVTESPCLHFFSIDSSHLHKVVHHILFNRPPIASDASSQNQGSSGRVVMADDTSLEALATGCILCHLTRRELVDSKCMLQMKQGVAGKRVHLSANCLVTLLTIGCLDNMPFVRTLVNGLQGRITLVPVIADEDFTQPDVRWAPFGLDQRDREALVHALKSSPCKIDPHGNRQMLGEDVKTILKKVDLDLSDFMTTLHDEHRTHLQQLHKQLRNSTSDATELRLATDEAPVTIRQTETFAVAKALLEFLNAADPVMADAQRMKASAESEALKLRTQQFVAPDDNDNMRALSSLGRLFDQLLYAISDAERGQEHYRYYPEQRVQFKQSANGEWLSGRIKAINADASVLVASHDGAFVSSIVCTDVVYRIRVAQAPKASFSTALLAREDVKHAVEVLLDLELAILNAYIKGYGDYDSRLDLEDIEIGPKIRDYQAGYNWVHDVVIKKKKHDDAPELYQAAMDSTAALQARAATNLQTLGLAKARQTGFDVTLSREMATMHAAMNGALRQHRVSQFCVEIALAVDAKGNTCKALCPRHKGINRIWEKISMEKDRVRCSQAACVIQAAAGRSLRRGQLLGYCKRRRQI